MPVSADAGRTLPRAPHAIILPLIGYLACHQVAMKLPRLWVWSQAYMHILSA